MDKQQHEKTVSVRIANALEALVCLFQILVIDVHRLADKLAPEPDDIVGSAYVANRLGMTTVWVAEMARAGKIPSACILAGSGNGKVWKFHRGKIDRWIESGRLGC